MKASPGSNNGYKRPLDDQALRALQQRLEVSPRQLGRLRTRFLLLRLSRAGEGLVKRLIDLLVASSMLMLISPLLLVVGLLIKMTDGGPMLFWQIRVGKWGKPFRFPKFRSMVVNAEEIRAKLLAENQHGNRGITFKMKRDPRITWIGHFIRKTSIDELPQLWCVIKGEMSLVGPRPALVSEVERYTLEDRRQQPGAVGIAVKNPLPPGQVHDSQPEQAQPGQYRHAREPSRLTRRNGRGVQPPAGIHGCPALRSILALARSSASTLLWVSASCCFFR